MTVAEENKKGSDGNSKQAPPLRAEGEDSCLGSRLPSGTSGNIDIYIVSTAKCQERLPTVWLCLQSVKFQNSCYAGTCCIN